MKTPLSLVFIMLFFNITVVMAQEGASGKSKDSLSKASPLKPIIIIDVQLLGPGIFLSANFDIRFFKHNNGLGLRAGFGNAFGFTVPLSINYLIGNKNKNSFLEIGAGITYYIPSGIDLDLLEQPMISPNTYVMYRYNAKKQPMVYRVGVSQVNVNGDFIRLYPTISIGVMLNRKN